MLYPPLLQPGDHVAIVAPARKFSREDIGFALTKLSELGLKVELGRNLFNNSHSYLSSVDKDRQEDFQNALDNPSIKAIFCGRGGYGSTRIVDDFNFESLAQSPKWIIGFSDITAIHLRAARESVCSIHGIMPVLFPQKDADVSIESLRKLLFEGISEILAPKNSFNKLGIASAEVVGGNLSLIVDSLGTKTEINTTNRILILEEIDEYFYKVDRMMIQLKRAGKLNQLRGLIIGHMTAIKESTLPFQESVEELVTHAISSYDFPVAFNFPSGHENPNYAWIHGGVATLDVSSRGTRLLFKSHNNQ